MADGVTQIMNFGLIAVGLVAMWLIFNQLRCMFNDKCAGLCRGIKGCKAQCWGRECRVTGPLGRVMYVDPDQAKKARQQITDFIHKERVSEAGNSGTVGRASALVPTMDDVVDTGPSGYEGSGPQKVVYVGTTF